MLILSLFFLSVAVAAVVASSRWLLWPFWRTQQCVNRCMHVCGRMVPQQLYTNHSVVSNISGFQVSAEQCYNSIYVRFHRSHWIYVFFMIARVRLCGARCASPTYGYAYCLYIGAVFDGLEVIKIKHVINLYSSSKLYIFNRFPAHIEHETILCDTLVGLRDAYRLHLLYLYMYIYYSWKISYACIRWCLLGTPRINRIVEIFGFRIRNLNRILTYKFHIMIGYFVVTRCSCYMQRKFNILLCRVCQWCECHAIGRATNRRRTI